MISLLFRIRNKLFLIHSTGISLILFHMIIFNYYFNIFYHLMIEHKFVYMFIYFSLLQSVVKTSPGNFRFDSILFLELNTLTILPSLLACACLKAAIKGLSLQNIHQIDEIILKFIHCNPIELKHTQHTIEQLFQSCLQNIPRSPRRRCLVPIETSSQQRTKEIY